MSGEKIRAMPFGKTCNEEFIEKIGSFNVTKISSYDRNSDLIFSGYKYVNPKTPEKNLELIHFTKVDQLQFCNGDFCQGIETNLKTADQIIRSSLRNREIEWEMLSRLRDVDRRIFVSLLIIAGGLFVYGFRKCHYEIEYCQEEREAENIYFEKFKKYTKKTLNGLLYSSPIIVAIAWMMRK